MKLAIDIGNTTVKAAVFESQRTAETNPLKIHNPLKYIRLEKHDAEALTQFIKGFNIDYCMVSATTDVTKAMHNCFLDLSHGHVQYLGYNTPIPISNLYKTPHTLGPDRLAAAIGAYFLTQEIEPTKQCPVLIIDSGTAITYDFVTADGCFLGGNISPGIEMRFQALHTFTAHLPYIRNWNTPEEGQNILIGNSTITAIKHGVIEGVYHEIEGTIKQFILKYPNVLIFLTGGDVFRFEETLKKRIFAEKFLVLKGLDIIIRFNQCINK